MSGKLRREECVEFEDCVGLAQTDLALLVLVDGAKVWIPHSHIHDDSEVYEKDTEGKLVISEWIAPPRTPSPG